MKITAKDIAEIKQLLSDGKIDDATGRLGELEVAATRTSARAAWEAENKAKAPAILDAAVLPASEEPYAILVQPGSDPDVIFGEPVVSGWARIGPRGGGSGSGERNPVAFGKGLTTGDLVILKPRDAEGKAFLDSVPDAKPDTPARLGSHGKAYGNVGKSGHQFGSVQHYSFFDKKHVDVEKP